MRTETEAAKVLPESVWLFLCRPDASCSELRRESVQKNGEAGEQVFQMTDEDTAFIEELQWNIADAEKFQAETGHKAVFPLEIVRRAADVLARREAPKFRINSYPEAVEALTKLSLWLCSDARAHYMCIETKQQDDDGREIAVVAHSLCTQEQFEAVHRLVEGRRRQKLIDDGEIPPGAMLHT